MNLPFANNTMTTMKTAFESQIYAITRELPRAHVENRLPEIEQALLDLQPVAVTKEEKFSLQNELGMLYGLQQDWPKTREALRTCTVIDSTRVEGWLGLAEHYHYYDVDLAKALTYIEKALEVALATSDLVRQVLGVKIRIALALANFSAVEQSLQMLVEYKCPKGAFDIALESDFIARIPVGAASTELVDRYMALVNSSRRHR